MDSHLKKETQFFRISKAFSLLELLLVVALIGILAAFAVPTYKTYLQKTRFMEVVQHSHAIRVAQSACLLQVGDNISACDTFAELVVPEFSDSANIQAIALTLKTGMITDTRTPVAGSYTFTLTPSINDDGFLTFTLCGSCLNVGFCNS